jgi:hypothetical protein
MQSIINGCKTAADVMERKAKFYDTLRSHLIKEEPVDDASDKENHKYYIYNQETVKRLEKMFDDKPIERCLSFLNKIAVLRKGLLPTRLEEARSVLISGKSATLQIARDEEIKPSGVFPLAVSIFNLTSRLWFKLSRGFGKNQFPASFDVIAKAQMTLATKIGDSLHEKFLEYKRKLSSDELSKEQAALTIVLLRKEAKKPEDLNHENVLDEVHFVSAHGIDHFVEEYDHTVAQMHDTVLKNTALNKELTAKEKEIEFRARQLEEKSFQHKQEIMGTIESTINSNNELLAEYERAIADIEGKLGRCKNKAHNKYIALKIFIGVVLSTIFAILAEVFSSFNIGYSTIKGFHFFAAIIVEYLILIIVSILTLQEWSFKELHLWALKKIINRVKKEYAAILQREYLKVGISEQTLNDYKIKFANIIEKNKQLTSDLQIKA